MMIMTKIYSNDDCNNNNQVGSDFCWVLCMEGIKSKRVLFGILFSILFSNLRKKIKKI